MTTNIKPLHDRVIVKRIEEGEQVRGGIIIPDSAKETGISHTTLWRLKKGKAVGINFPTLEQICRTLDCQPGDVLRLGDGKRAGRKATKKAGAKRAAKRG